MNCFECGCPLTPENFQEVEHIESGETVALCDTCYEKLAGNGRLEVTDDDGNYTCGNLHIFKGTNTSTVPYHLPCPECGSLTYLGVFIPTVSVSSADYYEASFQCHNPNCAPLYEEVYDDEEDKTYYDLVDSGAYWSMEDTCYFTPQSPRM